MEGLSASLETLLGKVAWSLATYRLLLAEDFALLVGLLFMSLHHVLQALLVGQVFLYLIVQYLRRHKM